MREPTIGSQANVIIILIHVPQLDTLDTLDTLDRAAGVGSLQQSLSVSTPGIGIGTGPPIYNGRQETQLGPRSHRSMG